MTRSSMFKTPLTYVMVLVAIAGIGVAALSSSQVAHATPDACAEADGLVSFAPGSGLTVASGPGEINDPQNALGYDGAFYSLGHGGQITLSFSSDLVIDGAGNDLLVVEVQTGEGAEILISADGVNFVSFGTHIVTSETRFDVSSTGLASFKYVRIIDDNAGVGPNSPTAGFDLDAVEALNCGEPEPTPTPVPPTPTPTTVPPTPTPTPVPPTPTPVPPTPTPVPPTATPTPPAGGEGCTPGYWKQSQHFGSWVDYTQSDSFDDVFGVTSSFGGTLLEAVARGGGGEKAHGRHAVAALLNSTNGDVDSGFMTAGVIQAVQDAYDSGDFEGQKNLFAADNEQGCDLGTSELEDTQTTTTNNGNNGNNGKKNKK